jgi:hypothetical protein
LLHCFAVPGDALFPGLLRFAPGDGVGSEGGVAGIIIYKKKDVPLQHLIKKSFLALQERLLTINTYKNGKLIYF